MIDNVTQNINNICNYKCKYLVYSKVLHWNMSDERLHFELVPDETLRFNTVLFEHV